MSERAHTADQAQTFGLGDAWCATEFGSEGVTRFARKLMEVETRRGLITMALLSLTIHIGVVLYVIVAGNKVQAPAAFLSTHLSLIVLSLHIAISTRWLTDIKVLNLMGMALLIVTAAALMLLAHRIDNLTVAISIGIALLFMAIPIMTWGLKESVTIVALVYLLLTASAMSVEGRFTGSTLWTLQFLIISSAITALVLIARNVGIRKHDMRARYMLEEARQEMERLSNIDPLTGCWNRRFLEQNYDDIAAECAERSSALSFGLLDVDLFKKYNDTFGHHAGDQILRTLANIMRRHLPGNAYLMRLGGDEFAVLYGGQDLAGMVKLCLNHLRTDPDLLTVLNGQAVGVSTGFAQSQTNVVSDLDELYQAADRDLYASKRAAHGGSGTSDAGLQRSGRAAL